MIPFPLHPVDTSPGGNPAGATLAIIPRVETAMLYDMGTAKGLGTSPMEEP